MIKRIIFDIDNTLLDTDKDCNETYDEYFRNKHIDLHGSVLYSIMDIYEEQNKIYSMNKNKENVNYRFNFNINDLSSFIRNNLSIDFDNDDFLELQDLYSKHATLKNNDIVDVLEELSKDYELVALSKWYCNVQENRLNKAGILKYFKKVYGFENAGVKPSKKTFISALGDNLPNEAIVIGDSISNDIIIPKELGINTIYVNYKNKDTNELNVTSFRDLLDVISSFKKGR